MLRFRRVVKLAMVVLLACAAGQVAVMAQARFGPGKQLARRPTFTAEQRAVFFPDARLELGPGSPGRQPAETEPVPSPEVPDESLPENDGSAWSRLVDAEVMEDEIKSYVTTVAGHVRSLNTFKSGGYQELRDSYSFLAVLFGVIAQYDGDVRWKDQAAGMRAALARAGFNCKVSTDASFKESKLRSEDLATLVRGGSLQLPTATATLEDGWPSVSDRPPLMKRMELAQHGRLDIWTANAEEFKRNRDKVLHEANLLRLLCEVIEDAEYEYADDELYLEYVEKMRQHCNEVIGAVGEDRFEEAQSAVSRINQQCDNCHGDFRG